MVFNTTFNNISVILWHKNELLVVLMCAKIVILFNQILVASTGLKLSF
jgi:hypothetical protein